LIDCLTMAVKGLERAALQGDISLPNSWVAVGRVSRIILYPVKSLAGVQVPKIQAAKSGGVSGHLVDRGLMVLDKKGKMVTGRKHPRMWLARVEQVTEDSLVLTYPGMEDLFVSLGKGNSVAAEVWGENCDGIDLGDTASRWVSDMVVEDEEAGLRLVQHPHGASTRPLRDSPASLAPLEKPEDCPLYADGYPYLLLSKASLTDLNTRLDEEGKQEVGEDRFRPNIVIEGDFPGFAEDSWSHVKIGDSVFRNVKLCTRCVFITVDPETGVKDVGGEPMKTLRTYRTSLCPEEREAFGSGTPFFGVNLAVEKEGAMSEGDTVFAPARD